MLIVFVSFGFGIIIWTIGHALLCTRNSEYFEFTEEDLLVTSKYFNNAKKCVTIFYKGILVDIESDNLYNFSKQNEKIKVGVRSWYIDGKCSKFKIIELPYKEYCKLYLNDEESDNIIFENE